MTRRLPLRTRLTVLFTVAFMLAGLALVGLLYAVLRVQLDAEPSVTLALDPPAQELSPTDATQPRVEPLAPDVIARIEAAEQARRTTTLRTFLAQSVAALLGVGALAATLGHVLAGRALHPLAQITHTARRVAGSTLHERIALDGPDDEVTELAHTFDGMLDRLDRSFAGQRAFVGNASHELKTPLAVQRTLIEVAMAEPDACEQVRSLGGELLRANERSEHLIRELLLLAQAEHQVEDRTLVDLTDLLDRTLDDHVAKAEARGITLRRELRPAVTAGNAALLGQVVVNLVDNAVTHNVPGGEVVARTCTRGRHAVIEIANGGRVVDLPDCERIFEPFTRLEEGRTGQSHGLGLSIVRSIVQAHGGEVRAQPRERGGLVVTVRLTPA